MFYCMFYFTCDRSFNKVRYTRTHARADGYTDHQAQNIMLWPHFSVGQKHKNVNK